MSLESRQTLTYWSQFASELSTHFDDDDDMALWETAINTIFAESQPVIDAYGGKDCLMAEIGRCSHWIRPHWRSRVGTTFPGGYGNDVEQFSLKSLPQFDWSTKFKLDVTSRSWQMASGQPSRRPLIHRITIPSRTARHPQATVHTIWTPGAPDDLQEKSTVIFAFERTNEGWSYLSTWYPKHTAKLTRRANKR